MLYNERFVPLFDARELNIQQRLGLLDGKAARPKTGRPRSDTNT